jgi:hypothetical protein
VRLAEDKLHVVVQCWKLGVAATNNSHNKLSWLQVNFFFCQIELPDLKQGFIALGVKLESTQVIIHLVIVNLNFTQLYFLKTSINLYHRLV